MINYFLIAACLLFICACGSGSAANPSQPISFMSPSVTVRADSDIPKIEWLEWLANGHIQRPVDAQVFASHCLLIEQQSGKLLHLDMDNPYLITEIVDVSALIATESEEQGLLSLCLDPQFSSNGHIYIYYTEADTYASVVQRLHVDTGTWTEQSTQRLEIIRVAQPDDNHNGGCLRFGSDGYLYLSLGDGGSANDFYGFTQDGQSLLGKMLRIDVSAASVVTPYTIPADNPFIANSDIKNEIYAIGFRNPWRFDFDAVSGRCWIGDVGQNVMEELDLLLKGANYGWPKQEGFYGNEAAAYTLPYFSYQIDTGRTIISGKTYRGADYPDLQGTHLFSDYTSGCGFGLRQNGDDSWSYRQINNQDLQLVSYFADVDGELYALSLMGAIYQMQQAAPLVAQ